MSLSLHIDYPLPLDLSAPFTTRMARDAGVDPGKLVELCKSGVLRRVVKGVYVDTRLNDSLALRARCLRLVVPEDAVVVDRHAGWLLGAQMILAPNENLAARPLSVFRPPGHGRFRNDVGLGGQRTFAAGDVTEIGGLRVTTPLRTAWDLGRVRWTSEAIAGLDAMFRLQVFSREEFLDGIERFTGQRWVTTLRAVGPLADHRSESPGESVLRLRCHENGLRMTPQVVVERGERAFARLDLANEELRVAAEYDGVEWHGSPQQQRHDQRRRADLVSEGWDIAVLGKDLVFGRARNCDVVLRELWYRGQQRRRRAA
jgi:hypothetical protein